MADTTPSSAAAPLAATTNTKKQTPSKAKPVVPAKPISSFFSKGVSNPAPVSSPTGKDEDIVMAPSPSKERRGLSAENSAEITENTANIATVTEAEPTTIATISIDSDIQMSTAVSAPGEVASVPMSLEEERGEGRGEEGKGEERSPEDTTAIIVCDTTPTKASMPVTETDAEVSPQQVVVSPETPAPQSDTSPATAKVLPLLRGEEGVKYLLTLLQGMPSCSVEVAGKAIMERAKGDATAPASVKTASKALLERSLKAYADNGVVVGSSKEGKKVTKHKVWRVKDEAWTAAAMEPLPLPELADVSPVKPPAAIEPAAETAPSGEPAATTAVSEMVADVTPVPDSAVVEIDAAIGTTKPGCSADAEAAKAPLAKQPTVQVVDPRAHAYASSFLATLQWTAVSLLGCRGASLDAPADHRAILSSLDAALTAPTASFSDEQVLKLASNKCTPEDVDLSLSELYGCFANAAYVQDLARDFAMEWAALCSVSSEAVPPFSMLESRANLDRLLAHLVHGSSAPLSELSAAVQARMDALGVAPQVPVSTLSTYIPLICGRNAYGAKPSATLLKNDDCCPCYLWRWEVSNTDLLLPAPKDEETGKPTKSQLKEDDLRKKLLTVLRGYLQCLSTALDLAATGPKSAKKAEEWNNKLAAQQERTTDALRKIRCEQESQVKYLEAQEKKAQEKAIEAQKKALKSASKAEAKAETKQEDAKVSLPKTPKAAVPPPGTASLLSFFKTTPASKPSVATTPGVAPATHIIADVRAPTPERTSKQLFVHPTSCALKLPRSAVFKRKLERRLEAERRSADPSNWQALDEAESSGVFTGATADFQRWCIKARQQRVDDQHLAKSSRAQAKKRALESVTGNLDGVEYGSKSAGVVDLTADAYSSFLAGATNNASIFSQVLAAPGVARLKLLHFHNDDRPAYFGTWRSSQARKRLLASRTELETEGAEEIDERYDGVKEAPVHSEEAPAEDAVPYIDFEKAEVPIGRISGKRPLAADPTLFNYEVDSEAEWDESAENADDVTDLEVASENEEDDEEDGKDDGKADAKGYDYSDEWLCADDSCDYLRNEKSAAAESAAEEDEVGSAAPAAKRQRTQAGVQSFVDDAKMRELYTPNVDGTFDVVLGPFITEDFEEYVSAGSYPTSVRNKANRQKAWFREMAEMKCGGLPERFSSASESLLFVSPPGGEASRVALLGVSHVVPLYGELPSSTDGCAPQSEQSAAGVVKKAVPAELLPGLVALVHGFQGSIDKLTTAWKEWLKASGRDEAIVSNRQLHMKITEIACRGRWLGPNGRAPAPTASVDTAASTIASVAETGAAQTSNAGSVQAAAIEHIELKPFILAVMAGEKSANPGPAAFNKSRYVVKDEVLCSVGFQFAPDTEEAAAQLIEKIAERKVDAISKVFAEQTPQVSGKKRKTPEAGSSGAKPSKEKPVADAAKPLFPSLAATPSIPSGDGMQVE